MTQPARKLTAVSMLKPAANQPDSRPVAMMTVGELCDALVDRVVEVVGDEKKAEPLTLSGAELAERLGVSRTAVHRLRQQGAPAVKIGDCYRYEVEPFMAWLREREMKEE